MTADNTPRPRDPGFRVPTIEACFDYDCIEALVEWNAPDNGHTRVQLRACLEDLMENAVREHEARGVSR